MATGTYIFQLQAHENFNNFIKTYKKVLKSSNLVAYTACCQYRDKYSKSKALLVLHGLCKVRMVLWSNIQPPSFFPGWAEGGMG